MMKIGLYATVTFNFVAALFFAGSPDGMAWLALGWLVFIAGILQEILEELRKD